MGVSGDDSGVEWLSRVDCLRGVTEASPARRPDTVVKVGAAGERADGDGELRRRLGRERCSQMEEEEEENGARRDAAGLWDLYPEEGGLRRGPSRPWLLSSSHGGHVAGGRGARGDSARGSWAVFGGKGAGLADGLRPSVVPAPFFFCLFLFSLCFPFSFIPFLFSLFIFLANDFCSFFQVAHNYL